MIVGRTGDTTRDAWSITDRGYGSTTNDARFLPRVADQLTFFRARHLRYATILTGRRNEFTEIARCIDAIDFSLIIDEDAIYFSDMEIKLLQMITHDSFICRLNIFVSLITRLIVNSAGVS